MSGGSSHQDPYDLNALLHGSDLTPQARRAVFDVIASGLIEGDIPSRESVVDLIELAAGRLDGDECRRRIIARYASKS